MTRTVMPKSEMLREVAATLFYLYDVNNTKTLDLKEIETWMETCKDFNMFLMRYEPKREILENKSLLTNFPCTKLESLISVPLRTSQISFISKNNSDTRIFKKPRRLKALRSDLYSVNNEKLKTMKMLSSKISKYKGKLNTPSTVSLRDSMTPAQKNLTFMSPLNYTLHNEKELGVSTMLRGSLSLSKKQISIPYEYLGKYENYYNQAKESEVKKRAFTLKKTLLKSPQRPIVFLVA